MKKYIFITLILGSISVHAQEFKTAANSKFETAQNASSKVTFDLPKVKQDSTMQKEKTLPDSVRHITTPKKDTIQRPEPILKDVMKKNHDKSVKNWVSGKAYQMQGYQLPDSTQQDSTAFQRYYFQQEAVLDSAAIIELGKIFNDSSSYADIPNYCIFFPSYGLELINFTDNKKEHYLMSSCNSMLRKIDEAIIKEERYLTPEAFAKIEKLIAPIFPPKQVKKP